MNQGFDSIGWWNSLRHSGLLLDRKRLAELYPAMSPAISWEIVDGLRRTLELGHSQTKGSSLEVIDFVLSVVCGFREGWKKGPQVEASWTRRDREGISLRPERLWTGPHGCKLPVFIDKDSKTLGLGKGRRVVSKVFGWMRSGSEKLAVLTNGRQWRLLHAGLDYEAWCELDSDLWFEDGAPSAQLHALVSLLNPRVWTPVKPNGKTPLLQAVEDSRKGQADLSASLGERVRLAVEKLIDAHQTAIDKHGTDISPAELYRGAVRVVMRLVVVLFAEARGLLPVDNAVYHASYGLRGLQDDMRKLARAQRLSSSQSAWPRLQALFRLVHDGSAHPDLPVQAYGGELFQPGSLESTDGLRRAIWIFENACFKDDAYGIPDMVISSILEHLTRTMERIRSGRGTINVPVPVDFSDISSEYIGILYEGLLDYELKPVPEGDAVIILPIGNRPALPLSRLEAMTNAQLAELLAKFAKDSKAKASDADEEESEEAEEEEAGDAENEDESSDEPYTEEEVDITDTDVSGLGERVTNFLRRMVEQGKLVAKPRGIMTPEKEAAYRSDVEKKAIFFARDAHFPGKRYLVRWGGTRKGSGAFYTRPGLSGPLIHRTLAPLAYTVPLNADGTENRDAILSEWTPRKPEEILALKVCDIACGSGTFPVGALRFLTQALYDSVHFHARITQTSDHRSAVSFFGRTDAGESIADEYLPCLPDDETYEARLRARLKRHVAERCIYGVDLDPLAVELCRLSLWVETLDQDLPFTFLNHKIKCGNSLVGSWYDVFPFYPIMAWKERKAGDVDHSNGVHFSKGSQANDLGVFLKKVAGPDLIRSLAGPDLFDIATTSSWAMDVYQKARSLTDRLHELPVHESDKRAHQYSDELLNSSTFKTLKEMMDLWCACWFWPCDQIEHAPIPTAFNHPSQQTIDIAKSVAAEKRFFHWELEFPDVFVHSDKHERRLRQGFDAILGNPPWEIAKPNSKEFFSAFDPLYRALPHPERRQTQLFQDRQIEVSWLKYNETLSAWANYTQYASFPFGDPEESENPRHVFSFGTSKNRNGLHSVWRKQRSKHQISPRIIYPFRSQGGADINLYKLFIEQAHALLSPLGVTGLIVPAAFYNDSGAMQIRKLLMDQCELTWLFGFENRKSIFPIDSRFRFCCLIANKTKRGRAMKAAFGRYDLGDWLNAENFASEFDIRDIALFSPESRCIPEVTETMDVETLRTMYVNGVLLGSERALEWGVRYSREFDMTGARKKGLFMPASDLVESTPHPLLLGHSCGHAQIYVPLYSGKMIAQYDFSYQEWVSGSGNSAEWKHIAFDTKQWRPEFVMPISNAKHLWQGGTRLVFRDFARSTDERTMISAIIPAWPCGNKVPILGEENELSLHSQLALSVALNSFAFDFAVRMRITGMNLNKFIVSEIPVPDIGTPLPEVLIAAARLGLCHEIFASSWIELSKSFPSLLNRQWSDFWATTVADRLRYRSALEAIMALLYGLSETQFHWILRLCDKSVEDLSDRYFRSQLPAKGFWRTGCNNYAGVGSRAWTVDPELRLPNLSIIAYRQLKLLVDEKEGDLAAAVKIFIPLSGDSGWDLPEKVILSQYELGASSSADEERSVRTIVANMDGQKLGEDVEKTWEVCIKYAEAFTNCGIGWGTSSSAAPKKGEKNKSLDIKFKQSLLDLGPQ